MKNWVNLWFFLFLVMLALPTAGMESNAVSYWNDRGNDLFNQGNITGAIYCYDKAIELGNQMNAPISNRVVIQCRYIMAILDKNYGTQVFSKVCAEPISTIKSQPNQDSEYLTLSFDVSNPNSMHMRIGNIYVNVIKYDSIENFKTLENFGVKKMRGYFCNIKPDIGSYKCIQTFSDDEFIDIAPGELEHMAINVSTDTPGVYQIKISLDYAIGSETNSIIIGDVPGKIVFFDKNISQSQ